MEDRMSEGLILGTNAKPMFMVGGRGARSTGANGQIAWALQYIEGEPALVMWRAHVHQDNPPAFAICLSALHKYVDDHGNLNIEYATRGAMGAVQKMGFGDPGKAKQAVHSIVDTIYSHLEDMMRMKPRPDGYTDTMAEEVKIAEVIVRDNNTGKTIHEGEIKG